MQSTYFTLHLLTHPAIVTTQAQSTHHHQLAETQGQTLPDKFPMKANSNLDWERSMGLQVVLEPKAVCALFHKINVFLRNLSSTEKSKGDCWKAQLWPDFNCSSCDQGKRQKIKKGTWSSRLMQSSWLTLPTLQSTEFSPSFWASRAKDVR